MIRVSELKLPVTGNQKALEKKLAKALRVPVEEIKAYRIFKRSLDARKKDNIHYAYVVDAEVKNENKILEKNKDKHISKTPDLAYHLPKGENYPAKRPVVVGFGPAGMFAALLLAEMVDAGAPEEILYDAKPHIGTDLLRGVVKRLREKIISLGGEVRFFAKVTGFQWENDRVQAVFLQNGEKIEAEDVVLALGHSARDTFTLLYEEKFALEQKPFAMGVRIEHPQAMIDAVQYGDAAALLPAADYRLTYTTQKNRGVYTFCMCPGGYVVAAASEEGRLAVNGMSEHARDGRNANSALLVQIFPEDFGSDHPLAGMLFQRELEEKAFLAGGGSYTAPVQTVGSFLGKGKVEAAEVTATYRPAVRESSLDEIFPAFMTEALREALPAMGRKLKGFDRADAVLTAVESRSSSPIRILRDKTGMSLCKQGIYPAGEGAGYAGGIVSAAVDGIFVAEKIAEKYGWMK